jgi:import inner membrane translocase subunit TIM16
MVQIAPYRRIPTHPLQASKILAQILVVGSQIVGRAFVQAYKQAAANAGKQGASGARSASGASESTASSAAINDLTRKTGMTMDEALQILNVEKDASMDQIQQVHY